MTYYVHKMRGLFLAASVAVAFAIFTNGTIHAQGTSGTYGTLTVTGTASINALDIQGNSAIFGSWITNSAEPGVSYSYSEGTGGTSASFTTILTRPVATESWLRLDGSGNSWPVMELNQSNKLILTGSQTSGAGSIMIDPTVGQITVNGNQVFTSGTSLYLSTAGLFGVGTTSPTQKLDVNGSAYFEGTSSIGIGTSPISNASVYTAHSYSGANANLFGFYDNSQINSNNYGYDGYFSDINYNSWAALPRISGFRMGNPGGSGTKTVVSALDIDALTSGVTNYGVFLNNAPNGGSIASSGSTNITIMPGAGGNVGVNTSSPVAMLDVTGTNTMGLHVTNTATPGSSSGGGVSDFSSTIPTAADQRLGFYTLGAVDGSTERNPVAIQGYSSQAWVSGSASGAYLTFGVTPNNSLNRAEALRIAQNGYVGIGTTNPQAALDVSGTVMVSGSSSVILVNPAGDLSMGTFTSGSAPQ